MTFKRNLIIAGASVALLALVACEKNNKAEETQTTGATQSNNNGVNNTNTSDKDKNKNENQPNAATPDPNQSTIMRVTTARCQREMACGKIGDGKKWSDEQACRDDLGHDTYEGLKAKDCKTLLQDKVQTCLSSLASENCDNVESGLSRIVSCRSDVICK